MTKKQLKSYIMRNSNIDFDYNGKRYGIERIHGEDDVNRIYFWEWHNEATLDNHYLTFEEFEQNAQINGKLVVEILLEIDEVNVF